MHKSEGFKPPQAVRSAARRGLELRRKHSRGGFSTSQASDHGVGSGVQRASNLASGKSVSLSTVKRMKNFFSRHAQNRAPGKRESDGGPTAGQIAWLLWGGDAGKRWADKVVAQSENTTKSDEMRVEVKVEKVDETLGLVFGYAIVSKVAGEAYFDTQGDHIPEGSMLKASMEFMQGGRVAKDMHQGSQVGQVVFGFPVTEDIAKALEIEVKKTGFLVGMKPAEKKMLTKYARGEYTGFSIGGRRIAHTEVK